MLTQKLWVYVAEVSVDCILSYKFLRRTRFAIEPFANRLRFRELAIPGCDPDGDVSLHAVEFAPECETVVFEADQPVSRGSKCDVSVDYSVNEELVEQIVRWAGRRPRVDAFAAAHNARFSGWWWSEAEDAFCKDWGRTFMWWNPPFRMMERVVEKIITDGAEGILIVPEWRREQWWPVVEEISLDWWTLPWDVCVFVDGRGALGKGDGRQECVLWMVVRR